MEKQKEIIITERGVYKKVNDNGRIIIPHHKRAENKSSCRWVRKNTISTKNFRQTRNKIRR